MTCDSIQIIIPVYNEGENILKTLQEIESKVSAPYSVAIVYDFDEDSTVPVVKGYIKQRNLKNLTLTRNIRGKGALPAIRTGLDAAGEGAILVVMADYSDDLSVVNSMLEKINQGYDIVCGSRYMKGGKQVGGPKIKGLISRMIGLSLNLFTGIPTHDITNSFKMYRKSVLKDIRIESRGGFEIGMEIVVKSFRNGLQIGEVPSTWTGRAAGKSRFKLMKWAPGYSRWYFYAIKGRLFKSRIHINNKNSR
jgi:dolichol-phosphate mannosyltransferase